jgi:hypothetical protein
LIRVIDTNVLVLADEGVANENPPCALACILYLRNTQKEGRTGLDDGGLILREYSRRAKKDMQPGVGHAFLVHLYNTQHVPEHVKLVAITPHEERGFAEFPDDPMLVGFDPSDRKFVAVALSCGEPHEIANAVDSDWILSLGALRRNGVNVNLLCEGP